MINHLPQINSVISTHFSLFSVWLLKKGVILRNVWPWGKRRIHLHLLSEQISCPMDGKDSTRHWCRLTPAVRTWPTLPLLWSSGLLLVMQHRQRRRCQPEVSVAWNKAKWVLLRVWLGFTIYISPLSWFLSVQRKSKCCYATDNKCKACASPDDTERLLLQQAPCWFAVSRWEPEIIPPKMKTTTAFPARRAACSASLFCLSLIKVKLLLRKKSCQPLRREYLRATTAFIFQGE